MGTKVQYKSSLPGYYPMRDLNNDSNNHSWYLFYGERALTNAQYHNAFLPRASSNGYLGDDKDVVKQKMLEHEAIFKNQVFELHRLYRIQRDLMDKIKSTELCRNQLPADSSFSLGPLASQATSEYASRWNLPSFLKANSSSARHSISGVEGGHSSLTHVKDNNQKPCFLPPHIGSATKDSLVLESRPAKLRRKILDLQLPATEYIDTEDGEPFQDENIPDMLNHNHIKNKKIELESDIKLYADTGEKTGCLQDSSKSNACLDNRSCLADLNEPIQLEESETSTYVDRLGSSSRHRETQFPNPPSGPNSGLLNLQGKLSLNTDNGSNNVTGNNPDLDNDTIRGGTLPHFLESGAGYNYKKFSSHGLQTKMWPDSSQPMQHFRNEICEPPFYPMDKGKVGQSIEGPVCSLQFTKRRQEINGEQPSFFIPSHISTPDPTAPDFAKSWSNSNSSWENASTNFQKLTSAQTRQYLNSATTSHNNFHSPFQDIVSLGEKRHLSNYSQPNKGFDSEMTCLSGSFLGSSLEYKEEVGHPSSISYNSRKHHNDKNQTSDNLTHRVSLNPLEDSNSMDMKCPKERNFTVVFSNSLSSETEQKIVEKCALLPWLRDRPAGDNETTNSGKFSNSEELSNVRFSINRLLDKNETENGPSHIIPDKKSDECPSSRKLLGLPNLEEMHNLKNEIFHPLSSVHFLNLSEVEVNKKDRGVDINLPCDGLVAESDKRGDGIANNLDTEDRGKTKVSNFGLIDLNLCLSDDEESLRSTPKTIVKMRVEIDLEAPAISETEDIIPIEEVIESTQELASKPQCTAISQQDELMALAAEAIIYISSSVGHSYLEDATCNAAQDSIDNPLNLLVEMAISCRNDFENEHRATLRGKPSGSKVESSADGMDSFESMTLGLTETKEEEYMPEPLVPGRITVEEKATTSLQNRSRKGQARRGRQRRDFQRDILPGLASLSRYEVTEDLNTFGGLMRATGHLWNSGLTKRNSSRNASGRGRLRSVIRTSPDSTVNIPMMHQLNNAEMELENRSLTGWGKTTRRPRRQRIPGGNLAAIPTV